MLTQTQLLSQLAQCKSFKTDLTPMAQLMQRLGNPQDRLRFVHIAGTNGKGSTTTMVSAVLRAAGYRTGTFLSPYILEFRERIQCNGEMIPEDDLCALGEQVLSVVRELETEGIYPAEFDAVTAIAFLWFAQQHCDIVVLEVGLGGRIDSTNLILPQCVAVSAVTSISLDHVGILGDTETAIAGEKAGIFKQGVPVVWSAGIGAEATAVLRQAADAKRCPVTIASQDSVTLLKSTPAALRLCWKNCTFTLPLPGGYQRQNAATALAILSVLRRSGWEIPDAAIVQGMERSTFPARMELLHEAPLFWLDGAHNPEGIAALLETVEKVPISGKKVCLCGMMADKNCADAVAQLAKIFSVALTLTPPNPRAMTAQALAKLWQECGVEAIACSDPAQALSEAIRLAGRDGAVVCCGSLYLCSQIRPLAMEKFRG